MAVRPTGSQVRKGNSVHAKQPRPKVKTIYHEVRDRICILRYPPGMLLGETTLAKEFGVSRTPIRQVLQRLEFEGLVETKNGIGTLVTGVDFCSFRDVYEMRLRIASLIGEMSPKKPDKSDIALMASLLRQTEALFKKRDPEAYWRLAHVYHDAVGVLIGNTAMRSIYDLFYFQTARIWLHLVSDKWTQEVEAIRAEIAETLRALRAGDMRAVGYIKRNYISLSLKRLAEYVAGGETPVSHRKR